MKTAGLILPFAAAIFLYLIAPLVSQQAKRILLGQIAESRARGEPLPDSEGTPYYLGTPAIEDYVEYVADLVQVASAALLPIVGAVFSLTQGVPPVIPLTFLTLVALLSLALNAWLSAQTAATYVSRKWFGYSVVSVIGMATNAAGVLMVVVLGPA